MDPIQNPSNPKTKSEVAIALLSQKLDAFIEEERNWRKAFEMRMDKADGRCGDMAGDIDEIEKQNAARNVEIDNLKSSVKSWNIVNSIGVGAAMIFAYIVEQLRK